MSKTLMQANSVEVADYTVKDVQYEGREWIVVPVVMMKTGVHHGSKGAVMHEIDELGKIVEAWNGIPVTVGHPQDGDRFVTANSPKQLEQSVGRVFNTYVDGDKLKAEVWIDVTKATAVNPNVVHYIREKRTLDVSVGVFTEDLVTSGVHEGEQYEAVARNYRPDHLALLPDEVGACSWQDGCGIRVNNKQKKGGKSNEMSNEKQSKAKDWVYTVNESYHETAEKIHEKLQEMSNDVVRHHLVDVFSDGSFVYERQAEGKPVKLYMQKFEMQDNKVEFAGDPVEVQRKVTYPSVNMESENTNKNSENMEKEKK